MPSDTARRNVARAIGGDARRVIFTSGATEANNLALFGVAKATVDRRKILVIASEHSSVVEPAFALKDEEFDVQLLPVDGDGIVDLDSVERAVDERTVLVSAMHVNNETGVVQPVAEIAQICHRHGALLHSDCAQSLGRLPVRVAALDADLLTLSGHKCYGPKGIGALYVNAHRKVSIKPLYHGGGQQGGLRPGTLPVPLCVGFGEACRIAALDVDADGERMGRLGGELLEAILANMSRCAIERVVDATRTWRIQRLFPRGRRRRTAQCLRRDLRIVGIGMRVGRGRTFQGPAGLWPVSIGGGCFPPVLRRPVY